MLLAEIRRRKAEHALCVAATAEVQPNLMQRAMARALAEAQALMEAEVGERAGPRYERWEGREGQRNGTAPGFVVIGGRKVKLHRPRLCDADGQEIPLDSYEWMQKDASMDQAMLGKVIDGVAQRKVHRGLERDQPMPEGTETYGDSRSSVSRRWVAATEQGLAAELDRRLDDRRYLAVLIDGKGFGDHLLVAAMGIDEQGRKRMLGVWPGDSENTEVCAALLQDLADRGLDVRAGVLVIIDGSKALAAAVRRQWGELAILGRCGEHKKRNVLRHLPKGEHRWVKKTLWQVWHETDVEQAEKDLWVLIHELEPRWPAAAASLKEGWAETLTCQRLGLPETLQRALGTTNLIENAFSTTDSICHRVCRWRNGAQAVRWATMALTEAERGFNRVASPEEMAVLARAIERCLNGRVVPVPLLLAAG